MATDDLRETQHPLLSALDALAGGLDEAWGVPTWSITPNEAEHALDALARCRSRLAALELATVIAADRVEVGSLTGATSTGARWAELTRQTRARSVALVRHAGAMDGRHSSVLEALAAGRLLPEQAEVICKTVDALPGDLDQSVVDAARAHLLALAATFDAKELATLGKRVLDIVAPEVAEELERERLEREEAAAQAAACFTVSRDGHGKVHGRFMMPEAEADMLLTALDAIAAPRHHHATHGDAPFPVDHHGNRLGRPQRRGRAFCEYVRTRHAAGSSSGSRPGGWQAGGVDATVTVALDLAQLTGHSNAPASLSTGTRITASKARLWACGAGVVPVVLGGESQPLDVGRMRRYFTKAQRLALARMQGGCTAEGCDWPPGMCHAHHRTAWSAGGRTDLDEGYLLCPKHHARAHDPAYEATYHRHRITFRRTRPRRT